MRLFDTLNDLKLIEGILNKLVEKKALTIEEAEKIVEDARVKK